MKAKELTAILMLVIFAACIIAAGFTIHLVTGYAATAFVALWFARTLSYEEPPDDKK